MLRRRWTAARDDELSEELRAFVEHDADSKIRSGMTPEDARRAALIELGRGTGQGACSGSRAGARWEGIFRDIRYAMRGLGRAPGFSSSVIGNLSLGLAMIVAFALINGRAAPSVSGHPGSGSPRGDRDSESNLLGTRAAPTALADYPDVARVLDEGMPSLEGLASFTESDVAVTLPAPPPAAFVSPNYFDVLGRPEIGRTFAPEEAGAESPVAIISHALWMREFRAPSVVGQTIQAGGQIFEVIGVTPQGFQAHSDSNVRGVDLWLPIGFVDRVAMANPFQRSGQSLDSIRRPNAGWCRRRPCRD